MRGKLIIIFYILVVAVPLFLGFGYSLLYSLGLVGVLGHGFTLIYWKKLLADQEAITSIVYTIYLACASLAGVVCIALLMAYWLVFYRRQTQGLYKALFLPLAIPPLIAAFIFFHLLSPSGILSRIGYWLGFFGEIESFPRLINDTGGMGILVTHLFIVAPFFSIMFTNIAIKEHLPDLRALSMTLGSSNRRFITKVFIPILLQKGSPLMILYGIFFFGAYEVPLLLGRQSPQVLTIFITDKMDKFDLMNIPLGHAMAVVYTLLIGLFVSFLLWRFRRVDSM